MSHRLSSYDAACSLLLVGWPLMNYPPDAILSIYSLYDPKDKEHRYVGRSIDTKRRFSSHLYNRKGVANPEKSKWIDDLKASGQRPEIIVHDHTCPENALEIERRWVFHFIQQKNRLLNQEFFIFPNLVEQIKQSSINFVEAELTASLWLTLYDAYCEDMTLILKAKKSRAKGTLSAKVSGIYRRQQAVSARKIS